MEEENNKEQEPELHETISGFQEKTVKALEMIITEKNGLIESLNTRLKCQDEIISKNENSIAVLEVISSEKERISDAKDDVINAKDKTILEQEQRIRTLKETVKEKERKKSSGLTTEPMIR